MSDKSVYFMENPTAGLIKIGYSGDIKKRKQAIEQQTGQRLTVLAELPGGRELEKVLHESFSDLRQLGEWFKDSPRLRQFIETALRVLSGDQSDLLASVPPKCKHCPKHCGPRS